ncbi:MAG: leucine-rich repeat domain-containing protein [Lachnospiraceae bacterium]|nr:leucine-rich repeat domain-containing protein [Lachnospiraceae bacterium]
MKKITIICTALFLWVCVLLCTPSVIYAETTGGTCGENAQWSFDETTHTLTISGTGAMEVTLPNNNMPWSSFYGSIYYIVIEEGITHICDQAFSYSGPLKEVTIPKSVTSIGKYAFEGIALTHINLHDGITSIGRGAFAFSRLQEITIPAGVTELSDSLFFYCTDLKEVELHNGIKSINYRAFNNCTSLQSIVIPDSVTVLESDIFDNCQALTEVTIGKNIKTIPESCFSCCFALQEISIPNKVNTIENDAFMYCTALEKVTFGSGLKDVSVSAFYGCEKLKAFNVSKSNRAFATDEYGVLYSKDKKTLWLFPPSFSGEYTVLDGTQKIRNAAAQDCTKLTSIKLPDSVKEICLRAFQGCSSLVEVDLGNGVQIVDSYAFYDCESLKILTFPASLTSIGDHALSGCYELQAVIFLGNRPSISMNFSVRQQTIFWYPLENSTWKDNLPEVWYDGINWRPGCAVGKHSFVNVEAVEPSCSQEGCEASTYCEVCGLITVYPDKIPMLSHDYSPWVYITPAGIPEHQHKVSRTCSVCGNEQIEFARNVNASELPEAPVAEPEDTTLDATEDITESTTTDTSEPDAQTKAPVKMDVVFIVVLIFGVCVAGSISYRLFRKRK